MSLLLRRLAMSLLFYVVGAGLLMWRFDAVPLAPRLEVLCYVALGVICGVAGALAVRD